MEKGKKYRKKGRETEIKRTENGGDGKKRTKIVWKRNRKLKRARKQEETRKGGRESEIMRTENGDDGKRTKISWKGIEKRYKEQGNERNRKKRVRNLKRKGRKGRRWKVKDTESWKVI